MSDRPGKKVLVAGGASPAAERRLRRRHGSTGPRVALIKGAVDIARDVRRPLNDSDRMPRGVERDRGPGLVVLDGARVVDDEDAQVAAAGVDHPESVIR